MFNTSKRLNQQATSVLGAVAMSAACLFVAVSPARAEASAKPVSAPAQQLVASR